MKDDLPQGQVTDLFKRRRRYVPVFGFIIFLAVAGAVIFLDVSLRSAFFDIAEVRAIQLATETVQTTLQQKVADESLRYQDFIYIHKDNQGHVAMMQANTVKINKVAANTTLAVQKTLEELKWQSFSIPFGQVFGVPYLSSFGPGIRYYILPVGTVRVNVADKFESAGINQTRHAIYLNFETSVRIVIPTKSGEAVVATQVPLAESIIVGNVPSTFVTVQGGIFGNEPFK